MFWSLSTARKGRYFVFAVLALTIIVLNFVVTPGYLLMAAFNGWTTDLGNHQLHEMVVSALIWLTFVWPMAAVLYHPIRRVNPILVPFVFAVPTAVLAWLADSFLFTGFVIMSVLAFLALLFHPAGRSLASFDRLGVVDRRVAGVFALGAIPLLVYGGIEGARQLGPANEHVIFVHYGAMAIAAILVIIMGGLGLVRKRDWRFATWTAGVLAAFLGLASAVYPENPSSLGVIGGLLLLGWAVAFVAGVEHVRRGETLSDTDTADRAAAGSG